MHQQMRNELRSLIRNAFGQCEFRFYQSSVTVTLVEHAYTYTNRDAIEWILGAIIDAAEELDSPFKDDYVRMLETAEIESTKRFKLRLVGETVGTHLGSTHPEYKDVGENLTQEQRDAVNRLADAQAQARLLGVDDLDEVRSSISAAVGEAHEAQQLENLLKKEIEADMEEFLLNNLGAAMVLLQKSMRYISLDETKELMRFSYLSGLWKNARERDLQVLADVFNKHFEKYAQNWSLAEGEGGEG